MANQIMINGQSYDASNLTLPPSGRLLRDHWITPVGGVIQVDMAAALTAYKDKKKAELNAKAEEVRQQYITAGDGQAMTYREKLDEAEEIQGQGQPAIDALSAQDQIDNYPVISASVGIEENTLWECAQLVLATYAAWAAKAREIEINRLGGIKAINDAATIEDVTAAFDAVDWTGV